MQQALNKLCRPFEQVFCETVTLNKITALATLAVAFLVAMPGISTAGEAVEDNRVTITEIFVNRVNIFEPALASKIAAYRLANLLHRTTREQTILRELDVSPGDRLSAKDIAEFERILRGMDLFASATVSLQSIEQRDGNTAQLHINTRDRLSIVAGASGSFLGGVGELGFTLGERNVAGLGDSFLLSYTGNTEDEIRGALSYSDLHFINKGQRALYQAGSTEEGDFYRVRFQRPFENRFGKRAWSILAESVERDIDYYEGGASVVQIPEQKQALNMSRLWRVGTDRRSVRRGLVLQYKDLDYQPSRGVQADTIEAPLDSTQFYAGFLLARDAVSEYRKVRSLDTLKFTQDLSLGSVAELQFGFIHTNYHNTVANDDTILAPKIAVRLSRSLAAGQGSLLRFSINGAATFKDVSGAENPLNDNEPWSVTSAAKWFNTSFRHHTLAARLDYTFAESDADLPVQYTLGENNGLRGYANRLLSGRERLRLNIEDRMDFDWRVGVLDIGLLGFFDVGWVAKDDGTDQLKRSAGIGLRLGSNVMLGASVIRMDLAVPFDDDEQKYDPALSISVGQVFGF